MTITNEEYIATQQQLMLFAHLVAQLDLDGFIEKINYADAMGPILDPTLYMRGASKMEQIGRIAGAAREFRKTTREALEKLRGV